jgi:hypothetical protein
MQEDRIHFFIQQSKLRCSECGRATVVVTIPIALCLSCAVRFFRDLVARGADSDREIYGYTRVIPKVIADRSGLRCANSGCPKLLGQWLGQGPDKRKFCSKKCRNAKHSRIKRDEGNEIRRKQYIR